MSSPAYWAIRMTARGEVRWLAEGGPYFWVTTSSDEWPRRHRAYSMDEAREALSQARVAFPSATDFRIVRVTRRVKP